MHENENIVKILTPIQTIYLTKQIKFKFNEKRSRKKETGKKFAVYSLNKRVEFIFLGKKNNKKTRERLKYISHDSWYSR